MINESLLSNNDKIDMIDYNSEWKKTLIYKLSFGKALPSEAWKAQLRRLKTHSKNSFLFR